MILFFLINFNKERNSLNYWKYEFKYFINLLIIRMVNKSCKKTKEIGCYFDKMSYFCALKTKRKSSDEKRHSP